jgi:hypothetical protein
MGGSKSIDLWLWEGKMAERRVGLRYMFLRGSWGDLDDGNRRTGHWRRNTERKWPATEKKRRGR